VSAPWLWTVLIGGVAALDATPVGQTLLSQPLVTATVLGILWGDPATALVVGIVLQLLAASTLPIGARTPEDYAIGGVVGTALALALARHHTFPMAREAADLLGVLVGMAVATLGVPLIKWQRRRNESLARWTEQAVREGDERAPAHAQGAAVVLAFGVGVTFTAVSLALGVALLSGLAERESLRLARAWGLAQPLWLGLGIAQMLFAFMQRRLARAAVFGTSLTLAWIWLLLRNR
jgi:mannose/fructose/N-acetylgalactosamine-specific phosphotransferase system component IIC